MFVAEHCLSDIVDEHGSHPVSTTDGGTWYPQACQFLKLKNHIHFIMRKALLKEQYSISKIEPKNVLMTIIFHVEKRSVD